MRRTLVLKKIIEQMRNISFAITTKQFQNRSKTVTRRMGWKHLKVGDELRGVKKAMGLRKGEKIEVLGTIKIVDVRFEPLNAITQHDVILEGFPEMNCSEFIDMFCKSHKGCTPDTVITRIEYKYV